MCHYLSYTIKSHHTVSILSINDIHKRLVRMPEILCLFFGGTPGDAKCSLASPSFPVSLKGLVGRNTTNSRLGGSWDGVPPTHGLCLPVCRPAALVPDGFYPPSVAVLAAVVRFASLLLLVARSDEALGTRVTRLLRRVA